MTFAEHAEKSVSDARVLAQVDLAVMNAQWINCGAGIWYCNDDALYPEVGPPGDDLLNGFTAQTFGDIGSVSCDGIQLTSVASLALLNNTNLYYRDSVNKNTYICLPNYDEPWIHDIFFGIVHGFSFDEFIPIGSSTLYEGRFLGSPQISQSRDPLFWGKMQYTFGGISLINADGDYDTFAQDNDAYGNETRFLYGYKQLNISDYIRIHTGTLQNVNVSEAEMQINLSDKRMQLTKPIQYKCTDKNALDAIVEILTQSYNIQYNSTYYDTTAWAIARALVPVITINMKEEGPTINVIEEICGTIFGLFKIDPDNRFSFKIVDTSTTALTTIVSTDILNHHTISYDPSEVISSVKVGYNKNWDSDYVSPYTWYTDITRENAIWLKYKTYNQATFYTLLTNLIDATAFGTKILDYAQDVHGMGEIMVPMKYYIYNVGDIVNAEIVREKITMLGTKKVEIISKTYSLAESMIIFGYRIV
jgi:hypothetical protein